MLSDPIFLGPWWWVGIKLLGTAVVAVVFSVALYSFLCWLDYKFFIPMKIREYQREVKDGHYRPVRQESEGGES